ncbi:uncharacterized protein LOC120275622 [Dioscorea cayenensis subsp. rotundata]|uniref:Uncharacterized protein LOC120275622 n=1 Tax=Dioscorea cayennensis subsp. rotundata TaxID=55577 RepID=A0AB40CF21_DIOCR|nr:uncharacterized protein LOC120275622 [Dioscorea cayenensis subsp. rotundata]
MAIKENTSNSCLKKENKKEKSKKKKGKFIFPGFVNRILGVQKKNKTVPMNDTVEEAEMMMPTSKNFFGNFRKAKIIEISTKQKQVSSRTDTKNHFEGMIQNKNITLNPSSLEPEPEPELKPETFRSKNCKSCKLDSWLGLTVIMVTLMLIMIFGRAWAIAILSLWFYVLAYLRGGKAMKYNEEEEKYCYNKVDIMNTKEYKKRVILEGLLRRSKPTTSLQSYSFSAGDPRGDRTTREDIGRSTTLLGLASLSKTTNPSFHLLLLHLLLILIMTSKRKHAKKFSCLPSCFSISPELSPDSYDTDKPISRKEYNKTSFFTRFSKSKKTVPVLLLEKQDLDPVSQPQDLDIKDNINILPSSNLKFNFISNFLKIKGDRNRKKSNKLNKSTKSDKIHVSTKSKKKANQNTHMEMDLGTSTLTPSDRVSTKCPNSPEHDPVHITCSDKQKKTQIKPNGRLIESVRFFIPISTLTLIVFLGKAIAIAFLCFCFYSIPLLRSDDVDVEKIKREGIDFDSSKYKKKVVLEGLLDRQDRKSMKFHGT